MFACAGQYFVARRTDPKIRNEHVGDAIHCGEARLQPGWRIGFAGTQHLGVMLRVGVQPQVGDAEIHVHQITGQDRRIGRRLANAAAEDCCWPVRCTLTEG